MKRNPHINESSHLAYYILEYLVEHPDAEDSLEGIVRWWVLEQKIKHCQADVEVALGELLAQGLLRARQQKDGGTLYSINPLKVSEIMALLKERKQMEQDSS